MDAHKLIPDDCGVPASADSYRVDAIVDTSSAPSLRSMPAQYVFLDELDVDGDLIKIIEAGPTP